jgi:hypothetical protein
LKLKWVIPTRLQEKKNDQCSPQILLSFFFGLARPDPSHLFTWASDVSRCPQGVRAVLVFAAVMAETTAPRLRAVL